MLTPRPALKDKEEEPKWFFAQVTPFDVHVKLGHFSTLVWITDLQTGKPVPGVEVRIQKDMLKELSKTPEVFSKAVTDENGTAELPGTSKLDPALHLAEAFKRENPWLFVRCSKGSDIALVPLRFDFQVDIEGSNHEYIPSWTRTVHGHMKAWGATAQGIYKVGDTVQYKIYVRDQGNRSFILPPLGVYRLKVVDPTSRVVYQRDDIKLSEFGALDGEFLVPKNGAVGYYRFQLDCDFGKLDLEPLQVLVSDFTPSPFHVTTELNGNLFGIGDTVKVSTQAKLHAGGPYGKAAVGITATVETADFKPQNPDARQFQFDVVDKEPEEESTPGVQTVSESKGKLDDNGNLETQFTLAELPMYYGRLTVESSVQDERGKSVADRATASYYGRDRYVGLLQPDWVLQEGKPAKTSFIVVDQNGKTIPGVETTIDVQKLQIKAARVKEAGDAYPTQYTKEWITEENFQLVSGEAPQTFEFVPKQSGTIRIIARVTDSKGRTHKTVLRSWVAGKGLVLWESGEGNFLNINTEKTEYRVGETVRIFVQNPYPGACALITVERYGVLDHWVKTLEHSAEVIEITGFAGLSARILRLRDGDVAPCRTTSWPGGEDLGKPVFRMGYAKLEVKDQFKEVQVQCSSDKEVYKPRDKVKLDFDARPKNLQPGEKSPPVEIAVAVLDEAVFDLLKQKRDAFDPYKGFYKLDELDLTNFNLLMQLVGREKLEKKGESPPAAAGFDLSMRSVFKFVSYWNPSLRVDEQGKASVEFSLPDNLTGWRVLAMAVTPDDRMGLGEHTFKVNQLTEIRPVLPNQVLEDDSFSAGFSVMNRTGETRNIEVKITAEGPVAAQQGESAGSGAAVVTQSISAEPYKRYVVRLPLKATGAGDIVFTVQAGDERDRDSLRHVLKVLPRLSRNVAAAYGSITGGEASERIEFPTGVRPGSGLLGVGFAPSMLGGLEGAFDFMKSYPFECWEQKISRAVMAGAFQNLVAYLPKTFSWENSASEADKVLAAAVEFQAPNGGMAFYQPRDDYVSPFLSAFTARAFTWLRETGHVPPRRG